MFEQLRIKVAIRQTITLGLMLILVLSTIYLYNYTKMIKTINDNLSKMATTPFFGYNESEAQIKPPQNRDSLSIYIDNNNIYYLSDENYYESTTVQSIINYIIKSKQENSRIKVDGNYIGYLTEQSFLGSFIYLYDYTKEFNALRNVGIIIIVAGTLSIVAIALFSIHSAKKSVMPIESAFNKQQDLVANASHELKTPLTIINTDLSILNSSKESFSDHQKKWLDSINSQVGRMSLLVNEMLELARMDAVKEHQVFQEISLSDIVYRVVLGAEVLAYENHITLNSNIVSDIKIMGVDANIEKLIYILVENAFKYTDKDGSVDINVYADKKRAIFKVRNSGEGIDKKYLPNLFDRFYRTDEAHSSTGSFGLGLSIAKAIVDNHLGTIGVDTKAGEYTEFIVILKQI